MPAALVRSVPDTLILQSLLQPPEVPLVMTLLVSRHDKARCFVFLKPSYLRMLVGMTVLVPKGEPF